MTPRQNGEWNTLMNSSCGRRLGGGGEDDCLEMAVRRKGEIKRNGKEEMLQVNSLRKFPRTEGFELPNWKGSLNPRIMGECKTSHFAVSECWEQILF